MYRVMSRVRTFGLLCGVLVVLGCGGAGCGHGEGGNGNGGVGGGAGGGDRPSNAQAVALCVGLNGVDPAHYAGWPGVLAGCENDARDMAAIARRQGFEATTLITGDATRDAVLGAIRRAGSQLRAGGILMVSYSGHGDQIPDAGASPEDRGMAQTWCLYDGQLLDKELYAEWARFAAGVRLLVVSDSCHSQGITRMVPADFAVRARDRAPNMAPAMRLDELGRRFDVAAQGVRGGRVKALPPAVSIDTYLGEKERYDRIARDVRRPRGPIGAWVMSLTACKNDQLAGDGAGNGVFTAALKGVWAEGAFDGSYVTFHKQVAAKAAAVRPEQEAQRRMIDVENPSYWAQRPFTAVAP